jgi:dihydrodipicolinate synthase/N-acetylneuraminate lyase
LYYDCPVPKYDSDPRAWALSELSGCCGCVIPTFTSDLSSLNETAVRFDVQREKELGMSAILVVSEGGTTLEEYRQMLDICVDEAGEDLVTFVHASQPTFRDMAETIGYAERAGVDLVLPSYPLNYYPNSYDEIFEDTRRLIDSTRLGVFIFAIDQWNFARLHPAGFPVHFLERLVEACPNLAGIKNEVGIPYAGGLTEVFERFNDTVVVTDPLEHNAPIWIRNYGMRFMGTSNYEYTGSSIPRMLTLLSDPATWTEGMELYWKLTPARKAGTAVSSAAVALTSLVPRMVWKYQGWLMGFNGGPLRGPMGRLNAGQMAQLRSGARASGLPVTEDPDDAFFRGRNPA